MAKRDNHYEAAFEAWLRSRKIPYLAVDETKRSLAEGRSLKNLDFVVSPSTLPHSWLVDVKGRRFPTGKSYWKNWVTAEELQSLDSWETLFGDRFSGLLVFAYNVVGDQAPLPADELFAFRGGYTGSWAFGSIIMPIGPSPSPSAGEPCRFQPANSAPWPKS